MNKFDYLIVGGGIAGTTAAEEIRSRDQDSSIAILTEEPHHLYSRVLLPHFLRNENSLESVFVRKIENYQQKNIQLFTSTRVIKVNPQERNITTEKNEVISYGKLLIATGGKVNKLNLPGSDLVGIVYMRTLEDAKEIKELVGRSKEAVVLGGGFIGADFAYTFVKNNLETTVVIRGKFFWDEVLGENSGRLLSQILAKNGVKLVTETEAKEFVGTDKLSGLKLSNGSEIRADIAGVGIGIYLDTDYLKGSGLIIKKGIVTNEYLESSIVGIWAAGDVAEFYDPLLKRYHTLGNWANASAQGRTVGLNMVGEKITFETTSMYSINIFDSNLSLLGDLTLDEQTEVIERGSTAAGKLAQLLIKNNVIVGASMINMPLERNSLTRLIRNKTKITTAKSKLSDLNFDLLTIQ